MVTGFRATIHLSHPGGVVERISPTDGLFYQASIHPRGTELLYFGGRSGSPRIWRHIIGSPPGSAAPVTPDDSGARHPAFDWSGTRFVFASDRLSPSGGPSIHQIDSATRNVDGGARFNIFTANPDGTDVEQVTDGPFVDHRPCYSPDGRWIAFASNRAGPTAIWRVPADGSSPPTPVFTDHWGYRPWYTAGGDSILFYGPDGDRHRIWEVSVETGVATRLEADDRGMTHGAFVPPGRDETVVVHSTRGGGWGIWELPLRGATPPTEMTPPGFSMAAHPTLSQNGLLAFDVKHETG